MKNFITALFMLLIAGHCYTQDFRKGCIITNENDTIPGYIDYLSPGNSSIICIFKKDSLEKPVKYTPADLIGYRIADERYFVSKNVMVEDSIKTYFVEYLLDGIVNLYYLEFKKQDLYFIEKENVIYPLTNEEFEKTLNGRKMIANSKKYIGVLNWLMMDAADLSPKINNTKFDHLSLIQITKDYHNKVCKDYECVDYYNRSSKLSNAKWKIDFGIAVAFGLSVIKSEISVDAHTTGFGVGYQDIIDVSVVRADSSVSNAMTLNSVKSFVSPGIYLRINRNNRLSMQLEMQYEKINHSFLQFERLKFPLSLSFDLTRYQKVIPYFSVGIGFDYYLNVNNENMHLEFQELENINDGEPIYKNATAPFTNKSFIFNRLSTSVISLGCGLRYHVTEKNDLIVAVKSYSSFFSGYIGSFITNKLQIHNFSLSATYAF